MSRIIESGGRASVGDLAKTHQAAVSEVWRDLESINDLLLSKDIDLLGFAHSGEVVFS